MATYRLTPEWPESYRRFAVGHAAACVLLTAAAIWSFTHPDVASERVRGTCTVGAALAAVFLIGMFMARRSRANTQYVVTPDGVTRWDGSREHRIARDEIISANEYSGGLLLRTIDPAMWVRIPRDLIDYEECRREVFALHIPPATHEQTAVASRRAFLGRLTALAVFACLALVWLDADTRLLLAAGAIAIGGQVVLLIDRWGDRRVGWQWMIGGQALQSIALVGSLIARRLHLHPAALLVLSLGLLAGLALQRAEAGRESVTSVVR
jgi:hypothetical protein